MEKVKAMIERQIQRAGEIGNFKKVMEAELLLGMIDNQTVGMIEALNLIGRIHSNS